MKEFLSQYKNLLITVAIVLVILIGIYVWGRKSAQGEVDQASFPTGGDNIPPSFQPETLATRINETLSGWNWDPYKHDEWTDQLRKLRDLATDDLFVAVNNAYNQKYQSKDGLSLRERLQDEAWIGASITDAGAVRADIIDRMDRLAIK